MRTSSPHHPQRPPRNLRDLCVRAVVLAFAFASPALSQTVARPNWAGSGVTPEAWFRRAVFYRIDPNRFQDSTGSGHGDIPGITLRLGYLQSLGVDALILQLPEGPDSAAGFDDLVRAAGARHLRVLVQIGAPLPPPKDSDTFYLAAARFWLNQGAAGLFVDAPALAPTGDDRAAHLLQALRLLTDSFPGGRVLLAAAPPADHSALTHPLAQYAQLTASPITATALEAAPLRTQLTAALGLPTANPLLGYSTPQLPADTTAEQRSALSATLATMLLASRDAVLLDAGQEIGLADTTSALMQWTPTNVTPKPAAPETPTPEAPAAPAAPPDPNVYGAFKPYVPPPPHKATPKTAPKPEAAADELPPPVDPATLPGFTTAELSAPLAPALNVAVEDADPDSTLNLFRKLIAYHHGNQSMRNGTQFLFDHDALNALTWLRRAPNETAASLHNPSATIVVICNLSPRPLALSLTDDLNHLKIHPGTFRTLVTSSSTHIGPQAYDHISLPPFTVFLGELYH